MGRVLYIHLFIPLTKFHINGNLQIEHEHEQNIQHTNKTCSRNQNHLQGHEYSFCRPHEWFYMPAVYIY